ncbi:Ig-like domain-containing protein [Longimicrobium sp.]|uniref:Ig-like domain-containing protein n=1 Tax=Longimicrobium sp. TaxID=2029185 RepID=UPI002E353527|nr:Ig-like domain-containing protein [Longimicrobium sp.]HEX6039111.1 Ig-like domain-containing protein [Longimicrobium sp.]
MMRSITRIRSSILVAGLLALAACADRNPAAAPDGPAPLPPSALAAVTCTASVADGTVACGGAGGVSVPGVNAAVIGGQGVYVRLASSGASYDGADTFRVNVTVENLTPQALGTTDGQTPSPSGVRIFFASGPTATGGSGPVAVANEDGAAFFSAAGQPYFQYDGILAPGDTSAAKEWRFTMPSTVTRFAFTVYVAAPVRAEAGWVGVLPIGPSVVVGDTTPLAATVRNLAGGVVAGAPVTWTSSDTSIARVDAEGVVTGVRPGGATVTASSGGRTGSVRVIVDDGAFPLATVDRFEILTPSVRANGLDSLRFRAAYSGPPGLPLYMEVVIRHPDGGSGVCAINNPSPVPGGPMEWRCGLVPRTGVRGGAWRVESVTMGTRRVTHAQLLAAGAPAHVHIQSAVVDVKAPTLDSLRIVQDTVTADARMLQLVVVATDDLLGPAGPVVWVSGGGNPPMRWAGSMVPAQRGLTVPFTFQNMIPSFFHGGTFTVDSVTLRDGNENRRTYTRAALDSAGFRTTFQVVSPLADTVAPRFTHFSFAPDTVRAGVDTLQVRLYAFESVDEAGVREVQVVFQRGDDATRTLACAQGSSERVTDLGVECGLQFTAADAGTWRVQSISAVDHLLQRVVYGPGDVAAAGLPTEFVVVAP